MSLYSFVKCLRQVSVQESLASNFLQLTIEQIERNVQCKANVCALERKDKETWNGGFRNAIGFRRAVQFKVRVKQLPYTRMLI